MQYGSVTIGQVFLPENPDAINIKVDRSSVLGNPIPIDKTDPSSRNTVCDYYEEYFHLTIANRDLPFIRELQRILKLLLAGHNVELRCWCKCIRCHAETIQRFLIKQLNIHRSKQ